MVEQARDGLVRERSSAWSDGMPFSPMWKITTHSGSSPFRHETPARPCVQHGGPIQPGTDHITHSVVRALNMRCMSRWSSGRAFPPKKVGSQS
jgi:hypothetical protein